MFRLDSRRLLLVGTSMHVLETRLKRHDGFEIDIEIPAGGAESSSRRVRARFPAEWPGPDALEVFPLWMTQLQTDLRFDRWGGVGVMLERESYVAVGGMGCKGPPNAAGVVEIGYAVNPAHRGRGYATEMAQTLVDWLEEQPEVRWVTAETLETNPASTRVLEKAGFTRTGRREDAEGTIVCWEHARTAGNGRDDGQDGTPL